MSTFTNSKRADLSRIGDMAKALAKKYPCVGRLYDDITKEFKTIPKEERSDLTEEQKSQLHVSYSICSKNYCYHDTTVITVCAQKFYQWVMLVSHTVQNPPYLKSNVRLSLMSDVFTCQVERII